MKGRIAIITLIFVTALGLVFLLNGCEIFITVKPQPKGKVVDGRSGQGVAGATVKLVYATEEATTKEKREDLRDRLLHSHNHYLRRVRFCK